MRRRGKQGDLHGLTDGYLRRLDPEGKRYASRAATAWRRVVGEEIARHTMGSALRNGELLVYVDSPVWATELSVMSEQLRDRLNDDLGEDLVRAVRFTVSKTVREEQRERHTEQQAEEFYAPDDVDPEPLSEQERMQVECMAAAIRDESLRNAAIRAMTRHLEWKKGSRSRNGREKPSE